MTEMEWCGDDASMSSKQHLLASDLNEQNTVESHLSEHGSLDKLVSSVLFNAHQPMNIIKDKRSIKFWVIDLSTALLLILVLGDQ